MNKPFVRTKTKLWTTHFVKILSVAFIIGVSHQIQMTTLPLYAQHIGGSQTIAGLMIGIFTISALVFRPLVGVILDRKGRRLVLITGAAVFFAASLSYYFISVIWLLLLLRFIHGAGFSAQSTSVGTIVSDVVPELRLMEGIGYYGMVITMAIAVGPLLGFYLIDRIGISELYLVAAGISALGLVGAFFINYEKNGNVNIKSDSGPLNDGLAREQKSHFFERSALKPSLVMFFIALAQGSIISFLPIYAYSKGISNIGIYFTVNAAALMLTRPITGRLADRFGASRIILPGTILLIIGLALLPFASSVTLFVVIGFLQGLGSGSVNPVLNAIAKKRSRAEHRGSGNATFFSSIDAGYGIGSIFWGVVSQNAGFAAVYFGAAGSVTISLLIYLSTLRKSNIKSE